MSFIGVRDFSRSVSNCIESVEATGKTVVITRHGRPVAALVAVDAEAFEDVVLANAPAFIRDMEDADAELAAGETSTLDDALNEIERDEERARSRDRGAAR